MASYEHRVYREDNTYWIDLFKDDVTRTVTTYREDGSVVETRNYTIEEHAEADADSLELTVGNNEATLIAKALQAISINTTYINRASTTTAVDKAQIKALSRQVNALIKLVTRNLQDTEGT